MLSIYKLVFKNRKAVLITISLIMLISILCIYKPVFIEDKHSKIHKPIELIGYKVMIDNREIGIVEDKTVVNVVLEKIQSDIRGLTGLDITFDLKALNFKKIVLDSPTFTQLDVLEHFIKSDIKYTAMCWAININNSSIVYLKSKEEAEEVLNKIKSIYIPKASNEEKYEIKEVKILENVKITTAEVEPNSLLSVDDAIKYLLNGTTEEKKYKVKQGDSLWLIAKNNNMTVEEIIQGNPEINPTIIHIGDEINLIVPKPYLNVEVTYLHTYSQNIPYQIKIKKDSSLARTKWKIIESGKIGEKEVTTEVITKNGLLGNRKIIDEKIITHPETRIIVQGTKRLPEDELLSAFLPEDMGILTSRFGMRWGRHHNGIDAGVPVGTPVYAYMSGTVTFSGWKSGYGYLVILDHGNGYETYYAHNSKLLVKVGDKVSKRQQIAFSGNTGRSTGPHVHFEVHKNGKPINPITFLKNHRQ